METIITLHKDLLNRFLKSAVVFKLIREKCKVTYVGQTGRLFNTRVKNKEILEGTVIIIMCCLLIKRNMLIMPSIGVTLRFYTKK